jgi:hypothetical protein
MDDEERYGAGLREMMLTIDVPPPRADVPSAVRVGRRRQQVRTVGIAVLSVVVIAAGVVGYATTGPRRAGPEVPGVAPSATPQRCPVEVLGTIPDGLSRVVATDPTGRYFVGYRDVGTQTKVVLWTDGRPRELDVNGIPVAVNANGVITGYFGEDDTAIAWVYRNGYTTQLPRPAGYGGSMPTGMNARGDIVGYAMKGALDRNLPLFWSVDHPDRATSLSAPGTIGEKNVSSMRATGINDERTIVGWIRDVPVSWSPEGVVRQLPLPSGYNTGNPLHLRGRYAYGTLGKTGDSALPAVRWDLASGGPPPIVIQTAHRLVDGTSTGWTLASDPGTTNELIDPAGASIPLPAPAKATTVIASSISDDAKTIVGTAGENGETQVLWRC